MTRAVRPLVFLALALALVVPAAAATPAGIVAPDGLHAFLLRVDEPASTVFSRTPGFAWNPFPGAVRYEFQLSASELFRDNGVIYSDTSLTSPVASPALTLPWITGSPHALYARVRAVLASTTTPWSDPYGFDVQPSAVPVPLPSYPGLLRWTPVDGAAAYQVWFVDLPKIIETTTNVADEREFYTFHQAASWISQVHWRVRALRNDYNARANGLPAATYGAWSPVYSSVNPPFAVGPLLPTATVSDVISTGAATDPAHRLMPGFVYGGNQSLSGLATELYRVEIFTDNGCLNRVYTGALVGSPAYAPRVSGPLALPRSVAAITAARSSYLPDGAEGPSFTPDFEQVASSESLPSGAPTTGLPALTGATPPPPAAPTAPATGSTPATPATGSTPAAPATGSTPAAPATPATTPTSGSAPAATTPGGSPSSSLVQLINATGDFGPPVDLWDTDWSNGSGYYWTVIPVQATVPGAASTSVAAATVVGAVAIPVAASDAFAVGDTITVGNGGNGEPATVTAVSGGTLGVAAPLKLAHGVGEPVIRTSGNIQYVHADLAQDACAVPGHLLRFGKESEPTLTTGGEAFSSGLSPDGKLVSGSTTPSFYGEPLVAWTTALGANVYQVQWSKTSQPFVAEADPATTAAGLLTANTSALLPLTPGTWYYRVRGFDYSLPTGAQEMSWSDPQQIVATKPTFVVVPGPSAAPTTRELRVPAAGFSVRVPLAWSSSSRSAQLARSGAKLHALGAPGSVLRLTVRDGSSAALFVQTAADHAVYSHTAWVAKAIAAIKGSPGGTAPARCSTLALRAGAGVRCMVSTRVAGGTQAAAVYLIQHRGATYTLTFATRSRTATRADFAASAQSLRFIS